MADTNRPLNDEAIDRALREALDVSPSPEFLARVRMRIANDPAPRGAWTTWMPAMVGAAVIAAALTIAIVAAWRGAQVRLKPDTTTDVRLKADTATDVRPTPDTTTEVRLKPDTTTDTHSYAVSAFRRTVTGAEPEVLVPQAEIDMYRRLMARARAASSGALVDAAPEIVADLQPPPELTIEPIKIDPITPQSSGEGVHP